MCQKNQKRSIFSLFQLFTCDGCRDHHEDEVIWIGRQAIFIYHLVSGCNHQPPSEWLILTSIKLHQLIYDYITDHSKDVLLWLDEIPVLEQYEAIISCCLELGNHLQIIVN